MSYVLVTADFPGVTSTQRDIIYKCLTEKNWKKITEFGRDISTVWYAQFMDNVSEAGAISTTINEYEECSSPYCKPKLVIHFGSNRPTFHGLT